MGTLIKTIIKIYFFYDHHGHKLGCYSEMKRDLYAEQNHIDKTHRGVTTLDDVELQLIDSDWFF